MAIGGWGCSHRLISMGEPLQELRGFKPLTP